MTETFEDVRAAVRSLCGRSSAEYWRQLDADTRLSRRVRQRPDRGRLPRRTGAARLTAAADSASGPPAASSRKFSAAGGNGAACHAQMYTMGTVLRHGSRRAEGRLSAAHRRRRVAACRRSASPNRPAAPTPAASAPPPSARAIAYVINGQKVWTSAGGQSDLLLLLARTTPRDQVAKPHRRDVGVPDRYPRGPRPRTDDPADPGDDQPPFERGVLRSAPCPGVEPGRRGGRRIPLHPRRDERRAHPDRRRVHRRRPLVHRQGAARTPPSASSSAARSVRIRASSSRSPAPMRRRRRRR